jgi:hypothetical protein
MYLPGVVWDLLRRGYVVQLAATPDNRTASGSPARPRIDRHGVLPVSHQRVRVEVFVAHSHQRTVHSARACTTVSSSRADGQAVGGAAVDFRAPDATDPREGLRASEQGGPATCQTPRRTSLK